MQARTEPGDVTALKPQAVPLKPHPEIDCQKPDGVCQSVVPEPERPDLCKHGIHVAPLAGTPHVREYRPRRGSRMPDGLPQTLLPVHTRSPPS